jgi:HB1, ASXL, restriction endonuclease HTH domain
MPSRLKEPLLDIAVMAIEAAQKPLTCREIIEWAKRRGKSVTRGRTPDKTLHAMISRNIARDRLSPFVRGEVRGQFGSRIGIGHRTRRKSL